MARNVLSTKNIETEDSPENCTDGSTESEATLKQNYGLRCETKIKSMGRNFN